MTPQEIFVRMRERWLSGDATYDEAMLAEDVVVETPFAAPGRPTRTEGRERVLEQARAGRAGFPVRFDDCRAVVIHETGDPEVIIVEYELVGTHTVSGRRAAAPFIGVLRTRDGVLAGWREYQHTMAIAAATA
ncbi:phzA/B-like protein [Actinoplanes sp. SE50]|uniref:nuclear transport factor 2 family protein n=1 Tax=unclassified Actinoplanes TaxID=2626549 RepID=UPI00023ECAAD|nr:MULTISPECIES: nuclear transport factor 2 family protein [unclassified Actinoplanes]AEV82617.1 putative phzA/B-like protein [Actinoplanes sp. SE50/110]ATO81013.1 phzA/B-like protein [Actinoplanes sp. SE50]SLL98420.1 phzA/B-like protein [Actinoplanes sp. SE50/110]